MTAETRGSGTRYRTGFPEANEVTGDRPRRARSNAAVVEVIVAVYDFIRAAKDLPLHDRHKLEAAVDAILTG